MIFIHTSDLHLGSALSTRLNGTKQKERRRELLDSFVRITEEACIRGARAILIAGDLFDTVRPKRTLKNEVIAIIRANPEIDFLYVCGNHEGTALYENGEDLPTNLKLFGTDWTYYSYGQVTVAGRTKLGHGIFDTLRLDPEKKNVVMLHGALSDGLSTDGETIGLKDTLGRGIDYLALGHYHTYSKVNIDERGVAVYSGTPEGRGFDETGACGVSLISTDGESIRSEFIPTAKRETVIRYVDISDCKNALEVDAALYDELKRIDGKNLVRAVLKGKHIPELKFDTGSLTAHYERNFYYLEVKDESGIAINPDDYRYDRTLKGEFIRLVLEKEGLTPEMKDRIIRMGIGALMGDIDEI